jgi:hypothetical protein
MNQLKLAIVTALLAAAAGGCNSQKASCASYEVDGKTVIVEERCSKRGRAYDYVSCGQMVRDKTKTILCERGKGSQKYMYRVGTSKPTDSSVFCKE